jgi:rhamnosyltransferase
MSNQRLIACVILYEPDDAVIKNIDSYINYIDKLLIYDNSLTSKEFLFSNHSHKENIIYHFLHGNKGIASALNLAGREAIELGYQWLLTMDQDSSFNDYEFFRIFNEQTNKETTAIYAPVHVDEYDPNQSVQDVMFAMTSGNLLNLEIFKQIGGFEDKLFIDEVDHDYCLKAKNDGYSIKKICVSINHSVGKHRNVSMFGRQEVFFIHTPLRLYYIVRNNFYVFQKYNNTFPQLVEHRKKMLRKSLIGNLVFDLIRAPQKLYYIIKGYMDFRNNRFGKLSK